MKAVILCAGLGSRTGFNYPKCLYKFDDGSTLLSKNIEAIKKYGFKNSDIIFIAINHDKFKKKEILKKLKKNTIVVDIWNHLKKNKFIYKR